MLRWFLLILIGALTLAVSGAANAAGELRCGGRIIDPGVTVGYVLALCGKPVSHTVERVPVRARLPNGFSRVSGVSVSERMIYDRGWGRFPALLVFRDGALQRITLLPDRR